MGVGAGYQLRVNDLQLDFEGFKITERKDNVLTFEVPVEERRYEFVAEHPYWSTRLYAKMSGTVTGQIHISDYFRNFALSPIEDSEDETAEYIVMEDYRSNGLSIKDVFSGGYVWCKPERNWQFEKDSSGVIQTSENGVEYTSEKIDSNEMAKKISYVHEHLGEINDDGFIENDEEDLDEDWSIDDIRPENRIYLKDRDVVVELDLIPEWTNNTYSTRDEIEYWNEETTVYGRHEAAGFHWIEVCDMYETDYQNYKWWKELADERHKCFNHFRDDGVPSGSEGESAPYVAFRNWLKENDYISDRDLETEKHMSEYIPEYESFLKEKQKDEIADEISSVLNTMDGGKNKAVCKNKSHSSDLGGIL